MIHADVAVMQMMGTSNFVILNLKLLCKIEDPAATILLATLVSKYRYFKKNHMLTEEKAFYLSAENIEKTTKIKHKKQRVCIQKLKELGFIDTFLRGSPQIKYFIIHFDLLLEFFGSEDDTFQENDNEDAYVPECITCTSHSALNALPIVRKVHHVYNRSNNRNNNKKEKHLRVLANSRENMKTFDTTTSSSKFDTKAGTILKKTVDKNNLMLSKPILNTWIREVSKLRVEEKVKKEDIKKVILWYKDHYKDEYTPKIYKVSDFKKKFMQLLAAANKAVTVIDEKKLIKKLVIKDSIKYMIEDHLEAFPAIPKVTKEEYWALAQISVNNFTPLLNRLKKWNKEYLQPENAKLYFKDPKTGLLSRICRPDLLRTATYLCNEVPSFMNAEDFIEWGWLVKLSNKLAKWEGREGSILNYCFSEKHKFFEELMNEIIERQFGSDHRYKWESIIKAVDEYENS